MNYQRESELNRDLKLEKLYPVYLLYGPERYLQLLYRRKIEKLVLGGEENAFDHQVLDGQGLDVGQLYDATEMLALLAPRRLVVVDNLEADRLGEEDTDRLCRLMAGLPAGCHLLLLSGPYPFDPKKSKKCKKIWQAADQAGAVAELKGRTGRDLERFVLSYCQQAGGRMEPAVAGHLAERCGEDLQRLAGEVEKLAAYADGAEITAQMVDQVTCADEQADIYQLLRLICAGRVGAALALVDGLLAARMPVAAILSNLGYGLNDLVRARAALDQGKNQAQVVKDFHYRYEFRVKNALRDARAFPMAALARAAGQLAGADYQLKSGVAAERLVLEQAVVQLAGILAPYAR